MPHTSRAGRFARILLRVLLAAALLLVAGVAVASGWLYMSVRASLPILDGERALPGLGAEVVVERDALGVPSIRGDSRADVARATGFVHAQERYFQMDLLRRRAAGELSEIFGSGALVVDRPARLHQFRKRAHAGYEGLPADQRTILDAYTEGVREGLAALKKPPFEYLVLRAEPTAWLPEDTLLVIHAMYFDLQDDTGRRESNFGLMRDVLPGPLRAFLAPPGTEWDAPVEGDAFPPVPVPGPEVFDLRTRPRAEEREPALREEVPIDAPIAASNNWAVSGEHTATGRPILANDPHLGIGVPHIWYRASFAFPDRQGREVRVTGVTLPGAPPVVIGSNGHVAWGFTNSMADTSDLVVLEPGPESGTYMTPGGPVPYGREMETIPVRGAASENVEVLTTIWGPVIDEDHLRRKRALRWVAHDAGVAVNLGFMETETLRSVEEAFSISASTGIPAQNLVVADEGGSIGWTIMGPVPRRFGLDGGAPESWADGARGWDGWLDAAGRPRILNPPAGRIWTANNRVVEGDALALLGDGGFDIGARALQIRDALMTKENVGEREMLALQLDDRAIFLTRWRDLLLGTLDEKAVAGNEGRAEMRRLVESWGGHASIESAGYRIVRAFRQNVRDDVLDALTAGCKAADNRFSSRYLQQDEAPLWSLVTEQPAHLLDPRHATWHDLLLAKADEVLDHLEKIGPKLSERTWGERNMSRFQHPLSPFIPGAGSFLDLPSLPLPGDNDMPRVQSPTYGASLRLSVTPGLEAEGILEMAGGQSGHPLSPYYRAGFMDWAGGEPTPLLPGPAEHVLKLHPAGP